MGTEL